MKLNEGIESSPCTLEVSYIWGDVNTASGCASIIMPLYSTFLNLKKVNICIYIYGWSFRPTLLVECLIARAFFLLRYLYMVWCCRLRQPRRTPVSSSWIHPLSAVWTKSGWSQLQTPTLWSVASQPKREPGPTQRPCIPPDDDDWVLQDLQPPRRHQQPAWDESCGRGWSRSR